MASPSGTPAYVPDVIRVLEGCNPDAFCAEEIRNKAMLIVRSQNDNKICFDCGVRNPSWMSLTLSVFLCLECSGDHRSMGVHLTFVRSATLDDFTPMQIIHTACGGNARAKEFFRANGMPAKRKETGAQGARINYDSKPATRYREILLQDGKHFAEKARMFPEINAASPLKSPRPGCNDPPKPAEDTSQKNFGSQLLIPGSAPKQQSAPVMPPVQDSAEKQISTPTSIKVDITPPAAPNTVRTINVAPPAPNAKQVKAKALDFDFDFDNFEAEANA